MIQFNSNGTTLSKHEALHSAKTNSRNVLFHLLLLSNVHFFCVASIIFFCLWVSFIIEIRSFSSSPWVFFFFFFELVSDEKNKTRELCVESLTKRKTFLITHPPPMEIPAKNTIGLSIKKVTFTSVERKNRHLSYNFTLFHFFFLTHEDHTKTFTISVSKSIGPACSGMEIYHF